jgi:hypothetical protein
MIRGKGRRRVWTLGQHLSNLCLWGSHLVVSTLMAILYVGLGNIRQWNVSFQGSFIRTTFRIGATCDNGPIWYSSRVRVRVRACLVPRRKLPQRCASRHSSRRTFRPPRKTLFRGGGARGVVGVGWQPNIPLVSNSSSSIKLTLALEVFGWKG